MRLERAAVAIVIAAVVVVSVLSGPLVSAVDFTSDPDAGGPIGSGSLGVSVESVPETATLRKVPPADANRYQLRVPEATVMLSNVSGRPMLVYKIRIPDLGYTRGSTIFLDASAGGRTAVSMETSTTELADPDRSRLRGELLILTRSDAGERTVYRGNVTVEVER